MHTVFTKKKELRRFHSVFFVWGTSISFLRGRIFIKYGMPFQARNFFATNWFRKKMWFRNCRNELESTAKKCNSRNVDLFLQGDGILLSHYCREVRRSPMHLVWGILQILTIIRNKNRFQVDFFPPRSSSFCFIFQFLLGLLPLSTSKFKTCLFGRPRLFF